MLRIYCETLPLSRLRERAVTRLLQRHALGLVLAVRPWDVGELRSVAEIIAGEGIALSLWPMLSDEDGRWASASNAARFVAMIDDVVRALGDAVGTRGASEIFFDLEPPFGEAKRFIERALDPEALSSFQRRARARDAYDDAERILGASVARLRDAGLSSAAAVWPLVALDPPGEARWQRVIGTPVDALDVDRVSVMAYTTIFEGWSRGTVKRRHACALLARAAARTASRWDARGGISLGCVGTGAFEDEPVYESPRALADDVAIARACGTTDLTLFDLGGVLVRKPAEAWLEAFVEGGKDTVVSSRRVAAARTLARAATWALKRR